MVDIYDISKGFFWVYMAYAIARTSKILLKLKYMHTSL